MRQLTELADQVAAAKEQIEEGALYAHYRDLQNPYRVVGFAIIEATEEPSVLYRKETDPSITWVRTLHSWQDTVSHEGQQVPRFQKVILPIETQ